MYHLAAVPQLDPAQGVHPKPTPDLVLRHPSSQLRVAFGGAPQLPDVFVGQHNPILAGPEHAPRLVPGRRSYQLVRSLERGEAEVYGFLRGENGCTNLRTMRRPSKKQTNEK